MDYETRVIISQRYVDRKNGIKASLVDLCGNDVIVQTEQGNILKLSIENFKTLFRLNLSL